MHRLPVYFYTVGAIALGPIIIYFYSGYINFLLVALFISNIVAAFFFALALKVQVLKADAGKLFKSTLFIPMIFF